MKGVTRRTALGMVAVGAAASDVATATDNEKVGALPDWFVVGPSPVGAWMGEVTPKAVGGPFDLGTAPAWDEVVKALNGCHVFLIDARTNAGPEARFVVEGYPKVALEGKLFHEWQASGKVCRIQVREAKLAACSTVFVDERHVRFLSIAITLRAEGEDGAKSDHATCTFLSPDVRYDCTGAMQAK